MLAVDYEKGMEMMNTKGYNEHEGFFQDVLEIARRHKIMNPEKMRTEYAKVHFSYIHPLFFFSFVDNGLKGLMVNSALTCMVQLLITGFDLSL